MNYIQKFTDSLQNYKPTEKEHVVNVSYKVIELAGQINAWHNLRPIPERWYPIQLGRLAAQLNTSRELTASALEYAGWVEKRNGTCSLWQPK